MGDLPMLLNWKVYCAMENIIFDYIGCVLVFCAAFCVVAPVLVYVVSLIVGVVWQVIDEGDSESPDLLKKVMPFLYGRFVERRFGGFVVYEKIFTGARYNKKGNDKWYAGENVKMYCVHDNVEDANAIADKVGAHGVKIEFIRAAGIAFSLGCGFIFIPTITMCLGSSALCLLSLRWSRRGYKKVKKLTAALDDHSKDKEAHK